jgi:hypothetical protein
METSYVPQVGDILIVRGNSWLSRAIRYFMGIYIKSRNIKVDFVSNHCATIIDMWGVLMVIEANAAGIEARYTIDDYLLKYKFKVKRVIGKEVPSTYSREAGRYLAIPHKYDFLNFIYHIVMVYTGHWIGPKGYKATHRLYCSEYIALLLDKNYGIDPGKSYRINPVDVDIMEELEIVYKNF